MNRGILRQLRTFSATYCGGKMCSPLKNVLSREECFVSIQFLLQECNSLKCESAIFGCFNCGMWGGGKNIQRCRPTAEHSKMFGFVCAYADKKNPPQCCRSLPTRYQQVALAKKRCVTGRQATPSIILKITFQPQRPP